MKHLESKKDYIDRTKIAEVGDQVICVNDEPLGPNTKWLPKKDSVYMVDKVIEDITIYYKLKEDPEHLSWRASRFKLKKPEDFKQFDL